MFTKYTARYFVAVCFTTFVLSISAFAAPFVVTKTADTNDGVCDTDCSLREAVAAANAAAGDDTISFDPATFGSSRTIALSGGALNITGAQSLTITGTGSNLLTIDGVTNGIIFVAAPATASISNMRITGNLAGVTGRIQNNGTLTLTNVIVSNSANSIGLHALYNLGMLTITGSTFQNNPRTAIFNDGGTMNISTTTVTNNAFGIYNNHGNVTVTDSFLTSTGKGIHNQEGVATLTNVQIRDNTNTTASDHGGGVTNFSGGASPATMTLTNCRISNNQVSAGTTHGGGVANIRGSLTMIGTILDLNQSTGNGGGVYTLDGTVQISNTSISWNTSRVDGGAVSIAGSSANVTIANSTLSRNNAFTNGGGIGVTGGTVTLNHDTIANNVSDANNDNVGSGSGVHRSAGTVNVRNTAIGDNDLPGDSTPGGDYVGAITSQGYNLIENTTGTVITGSEVGNIYGQDPQFGRLANSADPVITRNPLPTSPLIDKADPVNFLPTDQRNIPRPQDGDLDGTARADIGAYERQVNIRTVTKTADTNDGTCDSDCSLREAVAISDSGQFPDNVIVFDPAVFNVPQTITLTPNGITVPDTIGKTLVIDGPGANLLTINGNNNIQVWFLINFGDTVVRDLKVTGCKPQTGVSPIRNLGSMTLINIVMIDNSTASGGGAISNSGRMRIYNSRLEGNSAPSNNVTHDGGGAIENDNGTLSIYDSWIINNSTAARGGGIRTEGGGLTEIFGSIITGNTAAAGGGIYHSSGGSEATMNLVNTTVSGNTANGDGGGGGIYAVAQIVLNLTNATIARNQATGAATGNAIGGGIRNGNFGLNGVNARNTLIGDNSAATSSPDYAGNFNSLGYNLIENTTGVTFFGDTTSNVIGIDPRLAVLRDNGGPTWTHALLPGSPAIDKASPTNFPSVDQRGFARPKDGDQNGTAVADIGAFERTPASDNRSPFDFDGDGITDIGIFRPIAGASEWWINRSGNGQTFALQFGSSTDLIAPADYTGDGRADIAFFRPSSGEWYVLRSEDFSFFALPFGANGDVPVPADYDADGKADFAVFRPSSSTWFISQSSGAPTRIVQFGITGDAPVVADYDGDRRADIGVFRQAAGGAEWWIDRSSAGSLAIQFGANTDKAVQGDYTGDGKADIAIWRPASGEWFIVRSEDLSFYGFPFGANGDVVAPGDYDGDGKFDATVFRPSSATWFVSRTTAGTQIVQFGANGDRPLANSYVP